MGAPSAQSMYAKLMKDSAELDERRQVQLANQLAGINRLLGILMEVHRIVNRPLGTTSFGGDNLEREMRLGQLKDLVVTQLADPPTVRFATEEGGRLYYVDGALAEKDGALVIMLKPVQ